MCHTYRCPHMDALHPHLSSGNDSVSKLKMATKCTAKASGKVYDYRRTAPSLYLPPPLLSLSFWTGNINKATFRRLTVFQFPLHDASHCWPRAMRWVAMPSRWRCRCRYIWMRCKRGRSGKATHRSPRMRSVSTSGHPPC